MWDILSWILIIAVFGGLIVAGAWYYKTQLSSSNGTAGLFGPRPIKRLGIVEQSNVDGRRKLVLIRRDDVEHLIMTGGPVDVVIETRIIEEHPNLTHTAATTGHGTGADGASEAGSFTRDPPSFS